MTPSTTWMYEGSAPHSSAFSSAKNVGWPHDEIGPKSLIYHPIWIFEQLRDFAEGGALSLTGATTIGKNFYSNENPGTLSQHHLFLQL
jgi:hypothetical protein